MTLARDYFERVTSLMRRIMNEEQEAISEAARLVADTIAADKLLHIFGSGGHSAMSAEELFYRAGGLVPVNAMLDGGVLLANGALRSNYIERTPNYAHAVLEYFDVNGGDVLIIVNAYGINACTIDAALEAKHRDCTNDCRHFKSVARGTS